MMSVAEDAKILEDREEFCRDSNSVISKQFNLG